MFTATNSHQRLDTDDVAVGQAQHRLVEDPQLTAFEGMAQRGGQLDALVRVGGQFLGVEGVALAAAALGLEQRRVGVAQQLLHGARVAGVEADADAGAGEQLVAAEAERRLDLLEDARGQRGGLLHVRAVLVDQGELVAAHARQGHAVFEQLAQAFGDGLEQLVADVVAEAFVDVLEVVEVDDHHRAAALVGEDALERAFHPFDEQQPVRQAGQRVVVRQVIEFVLRALDRGDVGEHRDVVAEFAVLVVDRPQVLPDREDFTALAPVPDFPAPLAALVQALPHHLVEGVVMAAGLEHRRQLAEYFLLLVTGDALEGAVDVDDLLLGIGHQHAFQGAVENRRGLAQAGLVGPARGVLQAHAREVQVQQGVQQGTGQQHDPEILGAVPIDHAFARAEQLEQQLVAEYRPQAGADPIDEGQAQRAAMQFHVTAGSLPCVN